MSKKYRLLHQGVIKFCLLALLVPLALSSATRAQKAAGPDPAAIKAPAVRVMVTGKLVKVPATGSEKAGWALELDEPEMLGGRMLTRIALDPAGKELANYVDKRLAVVGRKEKREEKKSGAEPEEYWVIVVQRLHPLPGQ